MSQVEMGLLTLSTPEPRASPLPLLRLTQQCSNQPQSSSSSWPLVAIKICPTRGWISHPYRKPALAAIMLWH